MSGCPRSFVDAIVHDYHEQQAQKMYFESLDMIEKQFGKDYSLLHDLWSENEKNREISEEKIRLEAYYIWKETGCEDSVQNWHKAEARLKAALFSDQVV